MRISTKRRAVEVARFFSRHLPGFHSRGDRGQTVNRRSKSAACDVVGSSEIEQWRQ